ncbi:RelA/spoT [Bacillus cereus Rock1-15]|uniref:hypothetical protein n=1 Tax=Bacillus cereus TaxID=1396 RepID=UPI0001A07E42|nr:hypothetical protein [Bacillus cereus]EEL27597.1 RelA/spoT [Bacillus cereus Rock1-15]
MNSDLSTFIENSTTYLDKLKQERNLNTSLSNIIEELEKLLTKSPNISKTILQGRIKSASSLREKILRKRYFTRYKGNAENFINDLPDLLGLRIICLLNQDEERIYKFLKSQFCERYNDKFLMLQNQKKDNYPYFIFSDSKQPEKQKNGNDIFRINMEYIEEDRSPIKIELQIKSLAHMFWGEMEHMLFYKNYTYHLNSGFYIKMMKSIDDVLKSIDAQLTTMHSHLLHENYLLRQMDDIKQVIAKTLYDSVQPQVKRRIHADIDLREVYNVIVQLLFYKCNTIATTFRESEIHYANISSLKLTEEDFSYEKINSLIIKCNRNFDPLLFEIDTLAKSDDIFWNYFIAIYKKILRKSYQDTIEEITMNLLTPIMMRYQENFDFNDDGFSVLFDKGILEAIMESFIDYKKIDFFLEDSHQKQILDIIEKSIKFHQFHFKDLKFDKLEDSHHDTITNIIKNILKLQFHYYFERIFNYNSAEELLLLNQQDTIWNPSIDSEELRKIVEKKTEIKSMNELNNLLHYIPKKKEDSDELEKTLS